MQNENEVKAGSVVINPLPPDDVPVDEMETSSPKAEETAPAEEDKQAEAPKDDQATRIDEILKANQAMIGKQSQEIGALRAKLEDMTKPPPGPSDDEVLNNLYRKMDDGEIDIAEGMKQALAINSNLTAAKVMQDLQKQREQEEVSKLHGDFFSKNPDYEQVVQSGVLKPYLEADPMADAYTAYHQFKADERIKGIQADYEQKILAAKEEGAKLAKGSEAAGKVIGKQGSTSLAPQVNKPFKNTQEASAAMLETLRQMRSASAQ